MPLRPRRGGTSTSQGRSYAIFQKALTRRNVVAAVAAARELPQLSLLDALELTTLIVRKDPSRHPRVAGRCGGTRCHRIRLAACSEVSGLQQKGERSGSSQDEIVKLLVAAPKPYRVLLSTAVFTGLRLMELLGLRWCDIDSNQIHVRHQLSRQGELVKLKTNAGKRDVVMMPELAKC